MFEQIASLENQYRTNMTNSEKIAIAIEKLPSEYLQVLMAEMHKEGSGTTACTLKMQYSNTGGWLMALTQ